LRTKEKEKPAKRERTNALHSLRRLRHERFDDVRQEARERGAHGAADLARALHHRHHLLVAGGTLQPEHLSQNKHATPAATTQQREHTHKKKTHTPTHTHTQ
jgi:hypothetical protein